MEKNGYLMCVENYMGFKKDNKYNYRIVLDYTLKEGPIQLMEIFYDEKKINSFMLRLEQKENVDSSPYIFWDWIKDNFMELSEYRNKKINQILS